MHTGMDAAARAAAVATAQSGWNLWMTVAILVLLFIIGLYGGGWMYFHFGERRNRLEVGTTPWRLGPKARNRHLSLLKKTQVIGYGVCAGTVVGFTWALPGVLYSGGGVVALAVWGAADMLAARLYTGVTVSRRQFFWCIAGAVALGGAIAAVWWLPALLGWQAVARIVHIVILPAAATLAFLAILGWAAYRRWQHRDATDRPGEEAASTAAPTGWRVTLTLTVLVWGLIIGLIVHALTAPLYHG